MPDEAHEAWPEDIGSLYKRLKAELEKAGIEYSAHEARVMIQKRTGLDQAVLISEPERLVPTRQVTRISEDLVLRVSGQSLSRIYGEREFWGMTFAIGPETLEPRPDTETLVSAALDFFGDQPPNLILDLGTGSGCVLLALLKEWSNSEGIGVDLSFETLKVAHENAKQLGVDSRARFICGSWAEALKGPFEMVVSNPPYIERSVIPTLNPEVREHDPILALDGGEDGLDAYRQIFFGLKKLLARGGITFLEIGSDQDKSIMRLAEKYGLSIRKTHRDLAGRARVVEISCGDK